MAAVSGPLHVSSLLRTMAIAPPSRDRHHAAAHQLASLDPKQFLANLQAAAANRSPHAIAALKTDMYELNDIFYKLSRAGHDVSAAQRDFQMLQAFVSQISISASSQPEKRRYTSSSSSSSHHHQHQHHRTASVPSSSSPPSHSKTARSRSDSISNDHYYHHTSTRQGHQPQTTQAPTAPRSAQGPAAAAAAGRSPSSTSSYSSSSSSSSRNISSTAGVLCPTPHRLIKSRRTSAPTVSSTASLKKVHFATHATVYTIPSERERGRSSSSPTTRTTPSVIASGIAPPPRPSCVPRASGGFSADGRSRF